MDHNPEVYYLTVESAKNWTLIIDSVQFFYFVSFMIIFSHFGSLGRSFGAPSYSWGPPRDPMRCLTSTATLTPCLVPPPVQLGKFADFWGLNLSLSLVLLLPPTLLLQPLQLLLRNFLGYHQAFFLLTRVFLGVWNHENRFPEANIAKMVLATNPLGMATMAQSY